MSRTTAQSRLLVLAIVGFASVLLMELARKTQAPLVACLMLASMWAIATALLSLSDRVRSGALLCGSVLFGLATVEGVLFYVSKSEVIVTETVPVTWRRNVAGVGSLPVPNTAIRFEEFLDSRLIVDVTYGIDISGLREISSTVQGRPHKVAFFGDSFMFGHGVEDDQTLPYYFVQEARGTVQGFNFAGEGWGPHQMLREIENGFVRGVAGAPDLAIYEAIPDHLRRVAGRAPWEDGPKYVLCRGNEACYAAPFHSDDYRMCRRLLDESWTGKFIDNHFAKLSRLSDLPLFLAVLKRTRTLLGENGSRFVVVLWDQNELGKAIMKSLRANQFDVIALSSIFPESDLTKPPITQLDRHPSPATNKAIARYLWEQIGEPLAVAH